MADVIYIFGNKLGYEHAICECNNNTFHIHVVDGKFQGIICSLCENYVKVELKPVWPNQSTKS